MNNKGYIEIKGTYYLVPKKTLQELEKEDLEKLEDNSVAYLDGDTNSVYIYRGLAIKPIKAGFYLNPNDFTIELVDYADTEKRYTLDDVVLSNPLDINSILDNSENIEIPAKEKKAKAHTIRNGGRKSSKNEEPISYEIKSEDDEMVRVLKETINEIGVTPQQIYEWHLENDLNESTGYNLIYGLSIRNSISYAQFCKWADILKRDIEIVLIKR